jgi:hypothetical protein
MLGGVTTRGGFGGGKQTESSVKLLGQHPFSFQFFSLHREA